MPLDLFLYQYRIGDVAQSVSEINQLRRISHIETVLDWMTQKTKELTCSENGKAYAAMKTQELLLSYLVTALLVKKDRKAGRHLAKARMKEMRRNFPAAYTLARKKYHVFLFMNHLCLTKKDWEKVLNSGIYRILRQ